MSEIPLEEMSGKNTSRTKLKQHVWPVNMNTYMRFSIYEGLQMYVIDKIMLFSSGKIYYLFLLSLYLFTYLFKKYKY